MAPPGADADLLPTALYLIQRGYWCAVYELYVDAKRTGALARDDAANATLRNFFSDSKRFPASVLRAVRETFDSGVSAARVIDAESRAAVAEYDARVARDDLAAACGGGVDARETRTRARDVASATDADDAFRGVDDDGAIDAADASSSSRRVDTDAKLDAACYEFLSRRGFRATALAMRDESLTAATLDMRALT